MSKRYIDLHLHTTFSDGTDSVETVVEHAQRAGLSAMTISDHDTVEPLELARRTAEAAGIEFVNGIELSADYGEEDVHILGYLFDPDNPAMKAHCIQRHERRVERIYKSIEQLRQIGIDLDPQEVFASSEQGTVGRPHIARLMVKHGYVGSFGEAFDVYLGSGKPGCVNGDQVDTADAIRLVRQAGGVAVLAHPVFISDAKAIELFVEQGLQGIEVYHPSHSRQQQRRYALLAERLNLVCTGGSDYHGRDQKEGAFVGGMKVSYDCLDALRSRHAQDAGT